MLMSLANTREGTKERKGQRDAGHPGKLGSLGNVKVNWALGIYRQAHLEAV